MATGQQRRKQRRRDRVRYEDTVAWLVVPVILIAIVYGVMEFARQLSGTPFGKLLGW